MSPYYERLYDLHIHSIHSDGRLSVKDLVKAVIDTGLSGFALTDHDTIAGLDEASWRAEEAGIAFVPGIELNTDYGEGEVHILGYFIDPLSKLLGNRLAELKNKRLQRAGQIVDRMNGLGFPLDMSRVEELAGGGIIGRPHIARAMLERGYISKEYEAFEYYIGRGRPAFVPRYNFTPREAVQLVRDSGGLPFLAHPGKIKNNTHILTVLEIGLSGLEVYYPEHSAEEIQYYLGLADKYGLLVSGGSDFHGPGSGENRETLGLSVINENEFQRILGNYKEKTD